MQYRKEIDGLRAIAVIPVIFFHAGFGMFSGGFVGVDVFFVISGYLITSIILQELHDGNFTLTGFYERRARRILPALFLVMLACLPFAWLLMLPGELKSFAESLIATTLFVSNFHFWAESGYFASATEWKPLLHTWSLAIEEQFYLFYPLFILSAWKSGKKFILTTLVLVFILSLSTSEFLTIWKPSANFYLIPTRGWELLLGAFVSLYLSERSKQPQNTAGLGKNFLGLLGIGLLSYSLFTFNSSTPFPGRWALLPTTGTALIILFATEETITGKILGIKPLLGIGLLSYSLYLWHQPIFAFARIYFNNDLSTLDYMALIIFSSLCAFLSWKYVEIHFRNRKLTNRSTILVTSICMTLFFLTISFFVIETKGAKYRFPYINDQLAKTHHEFASYIPIRFSQLKLSKFNPDDPSKKILLIGDSYAEDILNSIFEAGLDYNYQFSTHHISKDCGALLLDDYSRIKKYTSEKCLHNRSSKLPNGRFDDPELIELVTAADEIWFASSWKEWELDFLNESLKNIGNLSSAKIYFFGLKNFGEINLRHIIKMTPDDRKKTSFQLPRNISSINAGMTRILPHSNFINLVDLYCSDLEKCRLFDDEGLLLSFDGGHLTKEGAAFFGERLSIVFQCKANDNATDNSTNKEKACASFRL